MRLGGRFQIGPFFAQADQTRYGCTDTIMLPDSLLPELIDMMEDQTMFVRITVGERQAIVGAPSFSTVPRMVQAPTWLLEKLGVPTDGTIVSATVDVLDYAPVLAQQATLQFRSSDDAETFTRELLQSTLIDNYAALSKGDMIPLKANADQVAMLRVVGVTGEFGPTDTVSTRAPFGIPAEMRVEFRLPMEGRHAARLIPEEEESEAVAFTSKSGFQYYGVPAAPARIMPSIENAVARQRGVLDSRPAGRKLETKTTPLAFDTPSSDEGEDSPDFDMEFDPVTGQVVFL